MKKVKDAKKLNEAELRNVMRWRFSDSPLLENAFSDSLRFTSKKVPDAKRSSGNHLRRFCYYFAGKAF